MGSTSDSMDPEAAYAALAEGRPLPFHVAGVLDYSLPSGRELPKAFPVGMSVDVLNLADRAELASLPNGLAAYELNLSGTAVRSLPDDLRVESRLDLSRCDRLESLPAGLTVGTLLLRACTALVALPEGLDVWFLDLTGCWAFERWPEAARIRGGRLQLRGCTALRTLPSYVRRLAALDVRDCPNLTALPADLVVSGWLDLAASGLTEEDSLGVGMSRTQLRWSGVNIDARIAFRPESIPVEEVLGEQNAERRRVLMDRYGYGRFLKDAGAQVLDRDRDPGGERQLLRLVLQGDEDLVAMSCFCPSTGRQYMLRVPPQTATCRAAAAWIAGFDDPDDYRPVQET